MLHPSDVTAIIPTVSLLDNSDFEECVKKCLFNKPGKIIIVTDTMENAKEVGHLLQTFPETDVSSVEIRVGYAGVANKREQMAQGIGQVQTKLILFLDDHVFLNPQFLDSVLPAFEDKRVGLCGTTKVVRRQSPKANTLLGKYWERAWNVIGALYLERHNFEARATNSLDGGVPVISGRASMVRTKIVEKDDFLQRFTNERFFFNMYGPLHTDDDNFITRYVERGGWDIKFQHMRGATVETTLGEYPKFPRQCLRWARMTFRQNAGYLARDRVVWKRRPWTVWITFNPSLVNFALLWDSVMVYIFIRTKFFLESGCPKTLLVCLGLWICFTKLVKPGDYYRRHPGDFFSVFPLSLVVRLPSLTYKILGPCYL